jgi:hypothetical protein
MRRRCWVSPLVKALDRGAALVSCGIRQREEGIIEPVRGLVTTAMPRPLPWLMAVNVPAAESTGRSFAYDNEAVGGEILAYDVGGRMLEGLRLMGYKVESVPLSYTRYYTHIAGMSWRRHPTAKAEPRRWIRARSARVRFVIERIRFAVLLTTNTKRALLLSVP